MRKVCIALIIVMVLTTNSYAAVMARTSMDLTFSGTTANCYILVKETGSDTQSWLTNILKGINK